MAAESPRLPAVTDVRARHAGVEARVTWLACTRGATWSACIAGNLACLDDACSITRLSPRCGWSATMTATRGLPPLEAFEIQMRGAGRSPRYIEHARNTLLHLEQHSGKTVSEMRADRRVPIPGQARTEGEQLRVVLWRDCVFLQVVCRQRRRRRHRKASPAESDEKAFHARSATSSSGTCWRRDARTNPGHGALGGPGRATSA